MKKEISKEHLLIVWSRFKSGDKEAYAILYNLHIDALYSYGTKLCKDADTVKDSLQELFLELFLNRVKIKISPENLRYYLVVALKRSLIKKMEAGRKVRHSFNESADFEPEYSIESQIMEEEIEAEVNRKVLNALNQLPHKQKEALYLRFNEALNYDEIAGILNIDIESVRKQVFRALKTVREIVGKQTDIFLFTLFLKRK